MKHENIERRGGLFPVSLQFALEKATKPAFKRFGVAQAKIGAEWDRIVGEQLARVSRPKQVKFIGESRNNGTLRVVVESGYALKFQHIEPIILEKIAAYFGYRAISRIRIEQAPVGKFQPPARPVPPPLAPDAKEFLEKTVQHIEDKELQAALLSLGEAMMQKT